MRVERRTELESNTARRAVRIGCHQIRFENRTLLFRRESLRTVGARTIDTVKGGFKQGNPVPWVFSGTSPDSPTVNDRLEHGAYIQALSNFAAKLMLPRDVEVDDVIANEKTLLCAGARRFQSAFDPAGKSLLSYATSPDNFLRAIQHATRNSANGKTRLTFLRTFSMIHERGLSTEPK